MQASEGRSSLRRGTPEARWLVLGAVVLLLGAAILLWRAVGQPRDRFWERIQSTGQWRVALDPSFPPFESLDEAGRPVGFDVDLANAIAAAWGVQTQFEGVGFDGLIDAVWASRVDAVISALPLQPQFSKDVAFSQPYFEAGIVVATPSGSGAVQSLADLAGRRVAVEWGSEGDVQARALLRRFPDLQIAPHETALAALQAVADGRADAALVDRISVLQFQGAGGAVELLRTAPNTSDDAPLVIVSDPYVIALPRRAPLLQREIGAALNALHADGTLEALTEKWFGANP